jgi:ABC-type glycerol-3-phosphate transport system substrate-binding protein
METKIKKCGALALLFILLTNIFGGCADNGVRHNDEYAILTSDPKLFAAQSSGRIAFAGRVKHVVEAEGSVYVLANDKITALPNEQPPIYAAADQRNIVSVCFANGTLFSFETDGNSTILVSVDTSDGTQISESVIDGEKVLSGAVVSDGLAIVSFSTGISVYTTDGAKKFEIDAKGLVADMVSGSDGIVYALIRGGNDCLLYNLDTRTETLRKITSLPAAAITCNIYDSGQYDMLYQSDNNLWAIDDEAREIVLIADLLESGIVPADIVAVSESSDGSVICYAADNALNSLELYELSDSAVAKNKQVLTLALFNVDNAADFLAHIAEYNSANADYRIEVVRYGANNGYYRYGWMNSKDGVNKFALDVAAGNIPDIIDVSTLPLESFARKGFFEDLYVYIDNDPALNREHIYPNVLQALEIDGRLYNTLSFFGLMTAYVSKSNIGDGNLLTYEDAMKAFKKSNAKYLLNVPRENFLSIMFCAYYANEFVNFETSVCDFYRAEFIQYLEMLKLMPTREELERAAPQTSDIFLNQTSLSVEIMLPDDLPIWQDGIVYTGMPSAALSRGIICGAGPQLAISSASKHKDAAWDFIRTMLTEDYQSKQPGFSGMRSNIAAQERNFNRIIERVGDERVGVIESRYNLLMDVFEDSHTLQRIDYALYDIIVEEALAYLAGSKTAEDTAAVIQSRASMYVAEQR